MYLSSQAFIFLKTSPSPSLRPITPNSLQCSPKSQGVNTPHIVQVCFIFVLFLLKYLIVTNIAKSLSSLVTDKTCLTIKNIWGVGVSITSFLIEKNFHYINKKKITYFIDNVPLASMTYLQKFINKLNRQWWEVKHCWYHLQPFIKRNNFFF